LCENVAVLRYIRNMKYLLILLNFFVIPGVNAQVYDSAFHYRLRIIPRKDRTDISVNLKFTVQSDTALRISLLTDYYSVPDLYDYIDSFSANNGCRVLQSDKKFKTIKPNEKKEVDITYKISYDPARMDDYSFGPVVTPYSFYLAGCQWMLPIGDIEKINDYDIQFEKVPANWRIYSSLSRNSEKMIIRNSYDELISSAIGGITKDRYKSYDINSNFLSISVAGNFQLSRNYIFKAAKKIVTLQREFFGDRSQKFYHVSINERNGIIAGTAVSNLFVCFVKSETKQKELNVLLSHEMLHTWLPNRFSIKVEKGQSDILFEWFHEGIDDYLARKILLKAQLIAESEFIERVNEDLYNMMDNPYKNFSLEQLVDLAKAGKYSTAAKKLSYYRGALIGYIWDVNIQKNTADNKSLDDFIKDLYHYSLIHGKNIPFGAVDSIGRSYSIYPEEILNNIFIKGQTIELNKKDLKDDFYIETIEKTSFDLGFLLTETQKNKKITGLHINSEAYKAGLREDMPYVKIKNSNRFGNGWSPADPVVVTVNLEGKETEVSYFPRGPLISVSQLRKK
jgi:predicted metalloprotease with PDZ domain